MGGGGFFFFCLRIEFVIVVFFFNLFVVMMMMIVFFLFLRLLNLVGRLKAVFVEGERQLWRSCFWRRLLAFAYAYLQSSQRIYF